MGDREAMMVGEQGLSQDAQKRLCLTYAGRQVLDQLLRLDKLRDSLAKAEREAHFVEKRVGVIRGQIGDAESRIKGALERLAPGALEPSRQGIPPREAGQ